MTKKSFIIHLDTLSVLDELDDKQAGKLFKTIKAYQVRVAERSEQDTDTGFDFTIEDFVTRIAFAPFKAQFERDSNKYEKKVSERSITGRMGNLKRWNPDLYYQVENKEITLKEAEVIASYRKTSLSDKSIAKHRKTSLSDKNIANVADSDSDSDSDSDIIYDNNSDEKKSSKEFLKNKQQIQMDRLKMKFKLSTEQLHFKIDEFIDKKFDWGENNWKNHSDMAKNFEFWMEKNANVVVNPYKQWTSKDFGDEISKIKGVRNTDKQSFYNHYSQLAENGRMRFQNFDAWNTELMLDKWIKNKK